MMRLLRNCGNNICCCCFCFFFLILYYGQNGICVLLSVIVVLVLKMKIWAKQKTERNYEMINCFERLKMLNLTNFFLSSHFWVVIIIRFKYNVQQQRFIFLTFYGFVFFLFLFKISIYTERVYRILYVSFYSINSLFFCIHFWN